MIKTINFLGDSITEGHGASCYEKSFVYKVGQTLNVKVNNYGIGGTRFAKQAKPSLVSRWDLDFCSRVDDLDKSADLVFVFGGTNDYGHGDAPIGTDSDRTPDTFYGALHYIVNHLLKNFKKEQIVFIMPLYRLNEDNPRGDGYKEPRLPLKGYRKIIQEVVSEYGIEILDFKDEFGKADNNKLLLDGLHPNDDGYEKITQILARYIKSRSDYSNF